MTKSQIEIFVRPKPSRYPTTFCKLDTESGNVYWHFPIDTANVFVNNQKSDYNFKFTRVFDPGVHQDTVFKEVAEKSILRFDQNLRNCNL
jgi:hypothetical protein